MPSSVAGRKARIYVAADSGGAPGSYNQILGIGNVTHSINGATIDDSEFGIEWVQAISGIPGGTVSMTGGRRAGDTTGQNVLAAALISGDPIWYKWLYGGVDGDGFEQQAYVVKFETGADVKDRVTVSIDLAGNGECSPVAAIP